MAHRLWYKSATWRQMVTSLKEKPSLWFGWTVGSLGIGAFAASSLSLWSNPELQKSEPEVKAEYAKLYRHMPLEQQKFSQANTQAVKQLLADLQGGAGSGDRYTAAMKGEVWGPQRPQSKG